MLKTCLRLALFALLALPVHAEQIPEPETFAGVGISLGMHGGPTALAVMPGSPAERAGVRPGDKLLSVDGQSTTGLSLEQIVKKIRGPVGSRCKLSLTRGDDPQPRDVVLARETLKNDPASQFALARQGAEKGFPDSQTSLGWLYYKGQGTAQDYKQALYWLHKAAAGGSARACFHIGLMNYRGEGAPPDPTEAYYWWRRAAELGFAAAEQNLGHLYRTGEGVARNPVQAYRWYRKAAQDGIADAQQSLRSLETEMTAEQRDAARAAPGSEPAAAAPDLPAAPPPQAPPKILSAEELKSWDEQLLP